MSLDQLEAPVTMNGATPSTPKPLTRLCALDTLFSAEGVVEVKVGSRTIPIPVQSVDIEDVNALAGKPPRAPMYQERVEGAMRRVRDFADPTYMDNLAAYNQNQMLIWVCMAINLDICDKSGAVVWSADNRVHNIEAAKAALKDMGLIDNQLAAIFAASRALTDSALETRSQE